MSRKRFTKLLVWPLRARWLTPGPWRLRMEGLLEGRAGLLQKQDAFDVCVGERGAGPEEG